MQDSSRLSNILFADIAGYTQLMQEDEAKALTYLEIFKLHLEEQTTVFQGKIVQYFGDGCLLTFDSSRNAMDCAIALQNNFSRVGRIPVRIGMHLGEVVFKDDNVYGDGVNIASRIESLGVPGAVLVSKTFQNQVKNKGAYSLKSLGKFHFKNVSEPLEVFAVDNPGFKVPKRSEMQGKLKPKSPISPWALAIGFLAVLLVAGFGWTFGSKKSSPLPENIRQQRVAVMPFENVTGNAELDNLGIMAMDWIGQGLLENGDARVIREDANVIITSLAEDPRYVPEGAEVLIKGRYYINEENKITLVAEIVSAGSNEVIYSPEPMAGDRNKPLDVIQDMKQQLLGYWAIGDDYMGTKPPRFDAYSEYIKSTLVPNDDMDARAKHFQRAMVLDSTYIQPGINLLWTGVNSANQQRIDSALSWLSKRENQFNEYERLLVDAGKARALGNFLKAADASWKLYEKYHDLKGLYWYNYYNNSHNRTSKILESFPLVVEKENFEFDNFVEQHCYLSYYLSALNNVGKYDTVAKLAARLKPPVYSANVAWMHLRALTKLGDIDSVKHWLRFYKEQPLEYVGPIEVYLLYGPVMVELQKSGSLKDNTDMLDTWEEWIDETSNPTLFKNINKALVAYLREDYPKALEAALKHYEESPFGKALFVEFPAIIYLKMGRDDKAAEWIEKLKQTGVRYPGGLDYAIGIYEGHRGNINLAVKHLRKANELGFDYDFYNYRYDFLTKELQEYPEFMELTEPY